jgi:Putative phage metallopeptidase
MPRRLRPPKPPVIPYRLLTRTTHPAIYDRMDELIEAHHAELSEARIALAWCTSWRCDVDGHRHLGKCKRASMLDRELADWDFVILLAEWYWNDPQATAIQRDMLLDHELCHATTKDDPATGEPVRDARGRIVYRLRRHDLEEFACIPERYGLAKRDLQQFARALAAGAAKQPSLLVDDEDASMITVRPH